MEFSSPTGPLRLRTILMTLAISAALALTAGANSAGAALPGPDFTSGPSFGEVLNTDDVDISFAIDPATLTGGVLDGYLCSLDGAPFSACGSPIHLADLSAGTHSFGVKASLTLLGGEPICVLDICIDPGPVTVETDVSSRTFSVDLSGGLPGLPGDPGSGGTAGTGGTNGTPGAAAPGVKTVSANLTRQMARCKKLRKKLRKHFTKRSNRVRVRKRYMRCLKVQRRMAARATTAAMRK